MEILVLSQREFEEIMIKNGINNNTVELHEDTFFISIHESKAKETYFDNKENVKVMRFDDCTFDFADMVSFTKKQALELLDFIDENINKKTCIIHCAAGISRSGAVGTFICDYTESDYKEFSKLNPHILPNILVLNRLKKAVLKKHKLKMY